jgi:hypothetical protein
VLEASSLAWWLLDPDIDSKTRLARLQCRLHSSKETKKAISALGLAPDDDPSEIGELPEAVMEDIRSAQLPTDESGTVLFSAEERRLGYTDWVAGLVAKIWPQTKFPYAVLSAVARCSTCIPRSSDSEILAVCAAPQTDGPRGQRNSHATRCHTGSFPTSAHQPLRACVLVGVSIPRQRVHQSATRSAARV